jgi:hypothetical protein
MATDWHRMAERLARRLETHAFCDTHVLRDARKDCPFCVDRSVYLAYVAAGGEDFRDSRPLGKPTRLEDLPLSDKCVWNGEPV